MVKASDFLVAAGDGHAPGTPGKRTPYIAALGRQIRENEFNKPTVNFLEAALKRCGFRTLQTAPTDEDTPLNTRTSRANAAGANLYISIHFNAMGNTFGYSKAKGFSVHIQPSDYTNPDSGSLRFAKLAVQELSKGTVQVNRGVVSQNLAITRNTRMPAALVECGFMDDEVEALLMINPSFQKEVAEELAMATCRYFKVSYVPDKPVDPMSKGYLVREDIGKSVGELQTNLNRFADMLKRSKIKVDNSFGPSTEAFLRAWQYHFKLSVDGSYGPATQRKMKTELAKLDTPKPTPPKEEVIVAETKKNEPSPWAKEAVDQAVKLGITDGSRLQEPATREEQIVMLMRGLGLVEKLQK